MNHFHLHNDHLSVVFYQQQSRLPEIVYLGAPIADDLVSEFIQSTRPGVPQAYLDEHQPLTVFPTEADGLFASPSLRGFRLGEDIGQQWCPVFEFKQWHHTAEATSQILIIVGTAPGMEIQCEFQLDTTGVLAVQHKLTNNAATEYYVDECSVALPITDALTELMSFTGRWCQEFQPQRQEIQFGTRAFENLKGRTSHDHFPGVVIGQQGFNEHQGQVMGCHLAWSGNHKIQIEKGQSGHQYLLAGAKLLPGEITLAPNTSFSTPWLYVSCSQLGLTPMSQQFHRFVRQRVLQWPAVKPRPVHLNTWEAVYFRHDLTELIALANRAADVGVERFILDDGWFPGRDHERAGLGDWFVDKEKYPQGLHPLIEAVKTRGMEFGLWFEPEMVNPDSELFRNHPDWVLQTEPKHQPQGRFQLVLDLANPEVFSYLFARLDALLTEYDIDYIKWDMNRDLVQASHLGRASVHKQTQQLYALFDEVRQKHPSVEIESCASGGGRIDFEILKRSHRFWTSDCNDALERQTIQRHFSLFFPPEVMGAHMGPATSHTTSRTHSALFRTFTAMFGHMGIEAHLEECSDQEIAELKQAIHLYKQHRSLLHTGDWVRLDTDDRSNCYGVVSPNQVQALFTYTQLQMPAASVPNRLRFNGLKPELHYQITCPGFGGKVEHLMKKLPPWLESGEVKLSGQQLMQAGLVLPVMDPESSLLIELQAVAA